LEDLSEEPDPSHFEHSLCREYLISFSTPLAACSKEIETDTRKSFPLIPSTVPPDPPPKKVFEDTAKST